MYKYKYFFIDEIEHSISALVWVLALQFKYADLC